MDRTWAWEFGAVVPGESAQSVMVEHGCALLYHLLLGLSILVAEPSPWISGLGASYRYFLLLCLVLWLLCGLCNIYMFNYLLEIHYMLSLDYIDE